VSLLPLCAVLACLSAGLVWLMTRVGVLDHPGERSSHTQPTPKGGGVGIVCAFLVGMVLLIGRGMHPPGTLGVLAAAALIAGISYMDDVRLFSYVFKLAAQVAAIALVIASGVRLHIVHLPMLGAINTGLLGIPLTAAWILFVTNAVNFMDGLNGLASGCTAIACLALAIAAGPQAGGVVFVPALLLVAGIAGFLPFNYPRARIFMGDVGSQFCGFLLGVLGVAASSLGAPTISALLMPMLVSPMLLDVAFTLGRRALAGDRLTQAHRGHLYQVAVRARMPAWAVTLVYWGMTIWAGLCGLALDRSNPITAPRDLPVVLAVIPFAAWGAIVAARARSVRVGRW
jgi:UDP-GlcNAc:undecaprenyl-phosphate GlcNAc-1-phosphate transferase